MFVNGVPVAERDRKSGERPHNGTTLALLAGGA
jgi:hypothetical protein